MGRANDASLPLDNCPCHLHRPYHRHRHRQCRIHALLGVVLLPKLPCTTPRVREPRRLHTQHNGQWALRKLAWPFWPLHNAYVVLFSPATPLFIRAQPKQQHSMNQKWLFQTALNALTLSFNRVRNIQRAYSSRCFLT